MSVEALVARGARVIHRAEHYAAVPGGTGTSVDIMSHTFAAKSGHRYLAFVCGSAMCDFTDDSHGTRHILQVGSDYVASVRFEAIRAGWAATASFPLRLSATFESVTDQQMLVKWLAQRDSGFGGANVTPSGMAAFAILDLGRA